MHSSRRLFAACALGATLAGVATAYSAEADATGIVPKLAISFNDKTLTSVGSVTMAGQTSVSADKFVEATNGYALDMAAVGSAVKLYESGGNNGNLSGQSSSQTAAPFAISFFGVVTKESRKIVVQANNYSATAGAAVGFSGDDDPKLTFWWVGSTTSWGSTIVAGVPEDHDWTQPHHYVFSFGADGNGRMRLYIDGEFKGETTPINNTNNSGYRNPAGKSYRGLSIGNAIGMNNYGTTSSVVDDVRFYADSGAAQAIDGVNYVLSDAMVAKLYRNLIGDDAVVKIGTAGYASLAAAIAVVQPGQTLTLNDNIVLTESAAIPAGVDIDFGTYTITTTTEGVALTATSDIYAISSTTADGTTTFSKSYLDGVAVWNGATGASWGTAGNWLVKGETATAVPSSTDTVVFPAHIDSARSVVIDAATSAGTVLVSGKYAFSGDYTLTATTLKVKDSGEFGIASACAYTGAITVNGDTAAIRVSVGDAVAYTLGALSLENANSDITKRNSYLYIDSGVVSFANICRIHTQIAAGATAVVTGNLNNYVNGYFVWFSGGGNLVFNGVTLNMDGKGDYGVTVSKFAGTLSLTNGTSITFSNNGNSGNGLGTGKAVLSGCTIAGGHSTEGSFGNSSIEVVAGTINTCTSNFALPLDKVLVTGGSTSLTKAQRTVLTTTRGRMTTGAAISDETRSFGWRVKTVANTIEQGEEIVVSNYTVKLYKTGFILVFR